MKNAVRVFHKAKESHQNALNKKNRSSTSGILSFQNLGQKELVTCYVKISIKSYQILVRSWVNSEAVMRTQGFALFLLSMLCWLEGSSRRLLKSNSVTKKMAAAAE